jgi:hypothetical protein
MMLSHVLEEAASRGVYDAISDLSCTTLNALRQTTQPWPHLALNPKPYAMLQACDSEHHQGA